MKIKKAAFAGSSTRVDQRPKPRLPEFAFIGRSNVGKSSLINMLTGNGSLAKTSSTPGKTRLVNHFLINDRWYLVDLPGYGFAKMPNAERKQLSDTINDYLDNSGELALLFVLVDSRHDIQRNDLEFIETLGRDGIPFAIIYTKCDKMGPEALKAQMERNAAALLEQWEELPPVFVSSATAASGKEDILAYIDNVLKNL
ncbi:MAG: YihA family ribosome biogenesis GTP-binding protein [Bacteroidales bacterium]|nr:YihA family ribosome biogenesis GTP-binding protein [Bacteroidales bacterium]